MAEVMNTSEDVSIDADTLWDAIRPNSRLKKFIKKDTSLVEEPSCSDALSDEEECCPRSSSPELEILEHVKNKSHITVDLTLEDDECKVEASYFPAKANINRSQDKNTPRESAQSSDAAATVLEISDDENDTSPLNTHVLSNTDSSESSSSLPSQNLSLQSFRSDIGESELLSPYKKPKLAWLNSFDEQADTISLMRELENYVNLPSSAADILDSPNQSNAGLSTIASNDIAPVSTGTLSSLSVPLSSTPLSHNSTYSLNGFSFSSRTYADSGLPQVTNVSQAVSSDSSATNFSYVTKGKTSPSVSSSAFSVPSFELTRQSESAYDTSYRADNTNTSSALPNSNDVEWDLIEMSIMEADLATDLRIPNPNSAFQTVNPGASRSASSLVTATSSSSDLTVSASTSNTLWNGAQPSTSMCGGSGFSNSSQNIWSPNYMYSPINGGFGGAAEYLEFTVNREVPQVVENGNVGNSAIVNSSQGSSFVNTGSLNLTSNYASIPQQSSLYSAQQNCSVTSVSQSLTNSQSLSNSRSLNDAPTSLAVSSISSTAQVRDTDVTPFSMMTAKSLIETYLHTPFTTRTQSQPNGSGVTDDKKVLDKDSKITPSSEDPYADPPSPEGPTISCHICLDSVKTIQSSSRNLCSTVCGHIFCSDCLKASLKHKKECPMCRRRLNKKQYHPLFL